MEGYGKRGYLLENFRLFHLRSEGANRWIFIITNFVSYSSFTRAYGKYFGTTPTGRSDRYLAREEDFE